MQDLHCQPCDRAADTPEIHHFTTLASTSVEARRWLMEGRTPPFWIVADTQSEGRGRQGRVWQSEPGNLYVSTGRRFSAPPATLATLSLVAGIAVHEAIAKAAATPLTLTLKWPNDIQVGEAKLGGILVESQKSAEPGAYDLTIGIGINITSSPALEERQTTHLAALAPSIARDDLLSELITSFESWLKIWNEGQGLETIITAWQQRAAPLGTPLKVRLGSNRIEGRFAGLDPSGSLLLKQNDGTTRTITGGELL